MIKLKQSLDGRILLALPSKKIIHRPMRPKAVIVWAQNVTYLIQSNLEKRQIIYTIPLAPHQPSKLEPLAIYPGLVTPL